MEFQQIGSLNIVKVSVLPKLICKFAVILIKFEQVLVLWQLRDDSIINMKIYKTKSNNDRKKNKIRELRPLDIKTDYKAMIIKQNSVTKKSIQNQVQMVLAVNCAEATEHMEN